MDTLPQLPIQRWPVWQTVFAVPELWLIHDIEANIISLIDIIVHGCYFCATSLLCLLCPRSESFFLLPLFHFFCHVYLHFTTLPLTIDHHTCLILFVSIFLLLTFLAKPERPDVPDEFSVVNVTESSAEIRWREPFNGNAVIVNYVVEYRVIDIDPASSASALATATAAAAASSLLSSSSSSSSSVSSTTIAIDRVTTNGSLRSTIVSGLRSSTFYNIRIAATNSIGQSDFTAWTRLRTEQSAPESPPLEVHATATGPNSVKITWKVSKMSLSNLVILIELIDDP